MDKPIIQEVIVVEGRDDTTAIWRAVKADTIETNGSEISLQTIEKIKLAQEKRGVIILTDPDFPGKKIRQTINEAVPGCKNAFIKRADALAKHGKGLGVEHAPPPRVIQEALENFYSIKEQDSSPSDQIPHELLVESGLLSSSGAKKRRERLGDHLRIGYTNGKQLAARLKMFGITKQQFLKAWNEIKEEEENV